MRVGIFEEHAVAIGMEPIEVVYGRGNDVVWFVCLDCRENREYGLVVFDSRGRALVMPNFDEEEAREKPIHIMRYEGGVMVNGHPAQRDSRLDMRAQQKTTKAATVRNRVKYKEIH